MIKGGIIQETEIHGTPFKVDLIPAENKSSRPALPMTPTSITVHETDNEDQTADARMHTIYVDNTRNYVSWHFTVDDNIIIQELPIIENAWHAGKNNCPAQ
ncbi:MAG: N-acetylmuramoyl-L-alanine amidase [Vallitaleaceae bacterium]|jgi:N-acetylmuramoyl-L-alanine amidase|nr:N-acetylmuramoyl-L-alanine amidase [Vallitaleaceae bacterium]